MSDRAFDIIVFGATGFTGKRVAQELAQCGFSGNWAVAGRDGGRLEQLASQLEGRGRRPGLVVANCSDAASLAEMARSTRVLINTVGPFRKFGEPVVAACVEAGTDYLDVCGEPEFIEKVEFKFDREAARKGCYVASAVGFDSVPGDLGVQYTLAQYAPPARCTLVESFLTIKGGPQGFKGHFPTFESAVLGFAAAGELRRLRKEVEKERGKVDLRVPGPRPPRQTGAKFDPRVNAWTYPFMGADASVIRRTMAGLVRQGEPAANVSVSMTLPSRSYMLLFQLCGGIFSWLAQREWGRSLLLRCPGLFSYGMFSHEGPSEQQMRETTFTFTNIAHGYSKGAPESPEQAPDMEVVTRVSGPEPGYIACSIFVVQAAITLLEERGQLGLTPGVYTPGLLLRRTSYIRRLQERGIAFERVDSARVQ